MEVWSFLHRIAKSLQKSRLWRKPNRARALPLLGTMAKKLGLETTGRVHRRRGFLLALLALLAFPGALWASVRSTVVATGYCPCAECCGTNSPEAGGHGLTASGERPDPGTTVAADWSVYPSGTRLLIQDIGHRVVQDRGKDIVGPRIDIFFRRHAEAVTFGRRRVRVRVVS
jgi:3D (Asp-Asp-Asp) domain-containing protein